MVHDPDDDHAREELRNRLLLDYIEAIERGHRPDRARLLGEYPELRPDLEAFLDGHDEIRRLTDPLHLENADESHVTLGELGDFRLLREVGRGGMGVVYEAEQISLRRRVALKILPFAAAVDPRRLRRFKAEALTAAQVQHERIVPVYAVGCERGVHYYAMRYIDGQSLAALIAELRAMDAERRRIGPPSPSLGAGDSKAISRERAEDCRRYQRRAADLAHQAALALEHAHQAGVVHRDVKPGNLLLDPRGQLWVTDFGLAQVAGEVGLTITGEMLGTLRYASPEQILARRGIVDHRSDIYSLGATLYELLTLRPPVEGRDRPTLIRRIADEEPRSPRGWDPSIPPELETVVLKALRKEPSERYATAQDMADDLRRFLDGRPILARPPTASERLRGWMRRHPSLVGSAALALLLLTGASVVSTALVRGEQARTLAEQRKAEAAYLREHQRAEEAEAQFRLARRAVDELVRASEEELAHRPGMGGLRKRLLASALAYYREFIEQRRGDPGARSELRDTTRKVETILADLAVLRAAGELYLLAQPATLADLRLDDAQRAKVAELSARAGRRWTESFGDPARLPSPADRVRIALEQARGNEAEVDAILTPAQRIRLRQIAIQAEGPGAFREPEVVEALALSPSQREQIRAIEDRALRGQLRGAGSETIPPDPAGPAMGRILGLLTPEQARRWADLAGEPIRGRLSVFPEPIREK